MRFHILYLFKLVLQFNLFELALLLQFINLSLLIILIPCQVIIAFTIQLTDHRFIFKLELLQLLTDDFYFFSQSHLSWICSHKIFVRLWLFAFQSLSNYQKVLFDQFFHIFKIFSTRHHCFCGDTILGALLH